MMVRLFSALPSLRLAARLALALRLALVPGLALPFLVPGSAGAALQSFERSELTIETAGGPRHFSIELAVTPAQMEQGLMFRRTLAADAGMLFEYNTAQRVGFWMKNTLIPLDMVFIGDDGRIVSIHERAVPLSTSTIESNGPVRGVLELNGGITARLGIKPGDLVRHPFFGNVTG